MCVDNTSNELKNRVAEFLTKYKHHVEYPERSIGVKVFEDTLKYIEETGVTKENLNNSLIDMKQKYESAVSELDTLQTNVKAFVNILPVIISEIFKNASKIKDDKLVNNVVEDLNKMLEEIQTFSSHCEFLNKK